MKNENAFIRDFYDGQIVKAETQGFKMFKLLLFSIMSAIGLFFLFAGLCNWIEFLILELGLIWNLYTKLNKKIGIVLCVFVSVLCFVVACNFNVYAHAIIYLSFYIPFQLFASSKKYESGDFVQLKKNMGDYSQIVFVISSACLAVVFYFVNTALIAVTERLYPIVILDSIGAACLVASAILRNERYSEHYPYRLLGLSVSIALWISVSVQYNVTGELMLAFMYLAYLIFDTVTYIVHTNTYVNEYMIARKNYEEIENKKVVEDKLKVYKKSKSK